MSTKPTFSENLVLSGKKPLQFQYPSSDYIVQKTEIKPNIDDLVNYSNEEKIVNISPTNAGKFSIKIYFYNPKLKYLIVKEINISLPEL